MTDDVADDVLPPSRLDKIPKPSYRKSTPVIPLSPKIMRQGTFELVKKLERAYPAPPQNSVLVANKPAELPDAGMAEISITDANTVPYTMKFISLNGGRTWYETYRISTEIRQFNYGAQVLFLPILHLADQHAVYGRLYDSSDKAIKSILYKKVNAKELVLNDERATHTPE